MVNKEKSAQTDTQISKCSHCDNTGRTQNEVVIQPYWITKWFCSCEKWDSAFWIWKKQPEQQEKLREFKQKRIDILLEKSNVWNKFRSKRIKDLSDIPELEKLCRAYVYEFKTHKEKGWWLYFWWNIGSGKTHAATAVCNELIEQHFTEILFVNMSDVSNRVRSSFDSAWNDSELFQDMKKVELLVIDDIGVEKVTEWLSEQLFLVVNYRYENNLPIIVTSNQSLQDLAKIHKPQIASRLDEMCKSVRFKGDDRRVERRPRF